jgi:hypothetical protein
VPKCSVACVLPYCKMKNATPSAAQSDHNACLVLHAGLQAELWVGQGIIVGLFVY